MNYEIPDLREKYAALQAENEALRKVLSEVRFWFSPDTMIGQALIEKVDAARRQGEKT